jgi:hypothetical protein
MKKGTHQNPAGVGDFAAIRAPEGRHALCTQQ